MPNRDSRAWKRRITGAAIGSPPFRMSRTDVRSHRRPLSRSSFESTSA
jgi:hypothetical protein